MVRYEHQTCLRMSDTLKNDMTDICEKYKINESDLMRRAVATYVGKLKSYARKLVTAISGGVFDLLYPVLERDSVDDLGELV